MWVTFQVLNRTSSWVGPPSAPTCLPKPQPPVSVHPAGISTVYGTGVSAVCAAEYVPGSIGPVLSVPSHIGPGEIRARDGATLSAGVAARLGVAVWLGVGDGWIAPGPGAEGRSLLAPKRTAITAAAAMATFARLDM